MNELTTISPAPISYSEIKARALRAYFDFCRDRGHAGYPMEQVLGSVSYEYENVFEQRTEQVIFGVVMFTLSFCMPSQWIEQARNAIRNDIRAFGLQAITHDLTAADAADFIQDVQRLQLV